MRLEKSCGAVVYTVRGGRFLKKPVCAPLSARAFGKRMHTICGKRPARGSRWYTFWRSAAMKTAAPGRAKYEKSSCYPTIRPCSAFPMKAQGAC